MARILQDGFETENKAIDSSYISKDVLMNMDVAQFVAKAESAYVSYNKVAYGICASRGGYGKKGFSIDMNSTYSIRACNALKYDLTKNCNDTSELYYRVWVYPQLKKTDATAAEARILPITITDFIIEQKLETSFSTSNFYNDAHLIITTEKIDQNTYQLKCYCKGVVVYTYDYLYYNEWVKIDVRLKVGDAPNGIFQLRINDKLITTFNGLTGTTNPKYMYIGKAFSHEYNYGKCRIDDIAVNDTTGNVNNSWCGNGSIVGIVPTANGSKTMFTPGVEGTQNFENVDDLTPDGDATYNSSYALNDIDLFKFTIPEELEIPPTETINAITISASAKFVEQPTDIGLIVSDGTTETLIEQHKLSNAYTSNSSIVQEKSDGTKYKVSDIEGLEFGYKTLESSQALEE